MPSVHSAPSLWTTAQKKSTKQKALFDQFKILDERADLENFRPKSLSYAEVEKVVEQNVFKKIDKAEVKRNLLNTTYFVVKNPKTNRYFRLTERDFFLWQKMDGVHTIRDLALEYFNKYGGFAYDKIVELVLDLKKQTLLEEPYVDLYQELSVWANSRKMLHVLAAKAKQALSVEFPIKRSDRFFEFLYDHFFQVFFNKISLLFLLFFSVGGGVLFLWEMVERTGLIFSGTQLWLEAVTLLLLASLSLILHEIAHGVTTKHFGRKVPEAGFILYFGWPAFYVDTTDMWMEEKHKRIAVSLAGPAADLLLAAVAVFISFFFPASLVGVIAFKFALASYVSVFVNMNPLVEWDGYFVFMDVLGIPCLRKRSIHFIGHSFIKKITAGQKFSKHELFYSVFGVLSLVWSVVAIWMALRFWQHLLLF